MAKVSSISFIRGVFFSPLTVKEKGKFPVKPTDKEDKSLALNNSALPAGDSVPQALRALGTAGLKVTAALMQAFNEAGGELAGSPTGALGSEDSLYVAYIALRGCPEGMLQPRNATEAGRNKALVLVLATAVLAFGEHPETYSPERVPNTLEHAEKLYEEKLAREAREAHERAEAERKAREGRKEEKEPEKEVEPVKPVNRMAGTTATGNGKKVK